MLNIVKNTTQVGLLDLLAPHSCRGCGRIGQPLCERCKNYIISHHQNLCPVCRTAKPATQPTLSPCPNCSGLPPIFIVGTRDSLLGDLIHDFKYQSVRALAHPLAEILDQTLPTATELANSAAHPDISIVPLPTINKHIRERALDHTHLIAEHFVHLRGQNYHIDKLFIRTKNSVQVGSSRKDRLAQASSAYSLTPHAKINPDTTYILFDDVWTTGASLQAAYALLKNAGAKNIIVVALALSS